MHWGKIKGGKAVFTKMGKDIVYLPAYYGQNSIQPAADPKAGEIRKLIPDRSKTQTLMLKRKYKPEAKYLKLRFIHPIPKQN